MRPRAPDKPRLHTESKMGHQYVANWQAPANRAGPSRAGLRIGEAEKRQRAIVHPGETYRLQGKANDSGPDPRFGLSDTWSSSSRDLRWTTTGGIESQDKMRDCRCARQIARFVAASDFRFRGSPSLKLVVSFISIWRA